MEDDKNWIPAFAGMTIRRGNDGVMGIGFPPAPKAPLSTPLALRKYVRGY